MLEYMVARDAMRTPGLFAVPLGTAAGPELLRDLKQIQLCLDSVPVVLSDQQN